ncbi:type II secretion system protein [Ideonella margarita]|uniref:Prepilin-type N-terminal cleavage/methylation domain-containing protein n=1 Tax=Ideonella margarita TaxID=2984191 RepID=A0ABU9C6K3_9BURK
MQAIGAGRERGPASASGFTLIELVMVVVILAVLASVALPRFLDIGTSARVAVVNALAGTLRSSAETLRMACAVRSTQCDVNARMGSITMDGKTYGLNYGWVGAGTGINTGLIDEAVIHSGFSVSIANPYTTFMLDGAPTPATCSVRYGNAWATGAISITINTAGC